MSIVEQATKLLETSYYTRTSLARELKVSRYKIDSIADQVPNMPKPLNRSQCSRIGRATGKIKWGDYFRLKGSPNEKRA